MKPSMFRHFLSMLSFCLTAALTGTALLPLATAADASKTTEAEGRLMTVNDGETGTTPFSFRFSAGWVHEGGYPDRFVGGDEHWTTTAQFGTSYPSFTLTFVGTEVSLYGHKVPVGAMAAVTVDGQDAGNIDYYHSFRIEKTLLWSSEVLPYGEHTVTVQLLAEKNPAAGDTHEASIDYAEIKTAESMPVTAIQAHVETLLLEPGMTYPLTYTLLPAYATETPTIGFASSDEAILSVDAEGRITAHAPGRATVTLAPANGAYRDTVTVTVREAVGGDLVAVAGSTLVHTRQDGYHAALASLDPAKNALSVVAWQNDIATAKIDLLTKSRPIAGIHAITGELTAADGTTAEVTVTVTPIRDTLAHDSGHLIPDVIGGEASIDLPASAVGSLWVEIETAADALPGFYTGTLTVKAADGTAIPLTLSLEIIGLARPENTVALELWQYPYSSNRYYSGKTTAEYFGEGTEALWHTHLDPAYTDALRSQIELFASAGGKTVTVTVTEDPWNSQTPDPYPSMVKWTRETDGSFTFDYTDFDYWVELNAAAGVDGPILSFSMADWANRITYMDQRSGRVQTEQLTPGSARWKQVWTAFLTDYMVHTTERGWFERTYLSMDERPAELVEMVLDLVEAVKNEKGECFKTSLAVFTFETEHLFDRVTDLSLAIYMTPQKLVEITAHRRALGLTTTLYTCGAQYSALENPPYESLYTLWYCEKMGADGFLRWALDAFNDDPLRSSAHRLFAAGDIYLFYPDEKTATDPVARTSPRFEKLAEGCRDISKLRYLRELSDGYETQVEAILARVGRTQNLAREVEIAQTSLNALGRIAALEALIAKAEAVAAPSEALSSALAAARTLVAEKDAAAADLTAAAHMLATLLTPATEETTVGGSNDTPETPAAPESVTDPAATDTAPETEKPSGGCASAVAPSALALAAACACVLKKRRE